MKIFHLLVANKQKIAIILILLMFGYILKQAGPWLAKTFRGKDLCFVDLNSEDSSIDERRWLAERSSTFSRLLSKYADNNAVIMLSVVDLGYVDMAMNLYLSSYKRFNLNNYIFICTDVESYNFLAKQNLHAMLYFNKSAISKKASNFGTGAFHKQSNIKLPVAYEALRLNFAVLLVDLDIVFLKNPLPYLTEKSYDLFMTSDISEGNGGFYLVRPTRAGISLLKSSCNKAMVSPEKVTDQKAVDRTYEYMKRRRRIKVKMMSLGQFPNGKHFWENQKRMFAGDGPSLDNTVIVHNNWVVSKEAKIYRFRESLMWFYDENSYYSSQSRRYVVYGNPVDFGKASENVEAELKALKFGLYLSKLLNRTLILPAFHCPENGGYTKASENENKHCSLMPMWNLATFDRHFAGNYREHLFLNHSLVPDSVKISASPPYIINTKYLENTKLLTYMYQFSAAGEQFIKLQPKHPENGPTEAELLHWFSNVRQSVLHFKFLYGLNVPLSNQSYVGQSLVGDLEHGFKSDCYMQSGACNYAKRTYRKKKKRS